MTQLLLQKYQWSPEEDDFIRRYVEKVGEKENVDWPKCSKYLQEETQIYRSGKQNTLIKNFLVKVMENKFNKGVTNLFCLLYVPPEIGDM